jgi:lauroyl/myristoyl acyltransferase
MTDWSQWRYYFLDLLLWALGLRTPGLKKRLLLRHSVEEALMREEIMRMRETLGSRFTNLTTEEILHRAWLVRITRESDTFTVFRMCRRNMLRFFRYEGLEHLQDACRLERPVVLLASHMGSLYTECVALGFQGFTIYPIARSADRSSATPLPQQIYITLNYRLTGLKLRGKYLFTHFATGLQRDIITVFNRKGVCFNAIDIPRTLYPHRRQPVVFLGKQSSLPSGFIHWAGTKGAVFLTMWNSVETVEDQTICRCIRIDPIIDAPDAKTVLQCYTDRLTEVICQEPWQWMALPIARQYYEV